MHGVDNGLNPPWQLTLWKALQCLFIKTLLHYYYIRNSTLTRRSLIIPKCNMRRTPVWKRYNLLKARPINNDNKGRCNGHLAVGLKFLFTLFSAQEICATINCRVICDALSKSNLKRERRMCCEETEKNLGNYCKRCGFVITMSDFALLLAVERTALPTDFNRSYSNSKYTIITLILPHRSARRIRMNKYSFRARVMDLH